MQQIILDLNNENYFCFNEFSLSRLLNESKRKTKKKIYLKGKQTIFGMPWHDDVLRIDL
jgi:hypothetical protein